MRFGFYPCFGYGGGWIMMILFFLVLIAIFAIAYSYFQKSGKQQNDQANAIEILKVRLAKGEISEEEYERLEQKLK